MQAVLLDKIIGGRLRAYIQSQSVWVQILPLPIASCHAGHIP